VWIADQTILRGSDIVLNVVRHTRDNLQNLHDLRFMRSLPIVHACWLRW
jgi:hypothetical protein